MDDTDLEPGKLFEREGQLAIFEAALAHACRGHGRLIFIEAARGAGKSALLDRFHDQAAKAAHTVLRAKAVHLESQAPYGVVRQMFEEHSLRRTTPLEREALFSGPAVQALPIFGSGPSPGGRPDSDFDVLRGLFHLTANIAADSPLTVLVDDVHLADRDSLGYVVYLAQRLDQLAVTLAVTARPGAPGRFEALVAHLRHDAGPRRLELASLSGGAVRQVVGRRLGPAVKPEFSLACAQATGGNPGHLTDLLSALERSGLPIESVSGAQLKELADQAITQRVVEGLGLLPRPAIEIARAVVILGNAARMDWAGTLSGLTPDDAELASSTLVEAEVLGPEDQPAPADPLVGSMIYETMPPADRRRLHARAARLLDTNGMGPEEVARHVMACPPRADPWVVDRLAAAARHASKVGALDAAASYLSRALAEPPEPQQRGAVLAELAQAEAAMGRPEAEAHFEAAIELLDDPTEQAGSLDRLGRYLLFRAEPRKATKTFEHGLELLDGRHPELAARLEGGAMVAGRIYVATAAQTTERLSLAAEQWRNTPTSRDTPADCDTPTSRELLAHLAHARAFARDGAAGEVTHLALAAMGGDPGAPEVVEIDPISFYLAVKALIYADELDSADAAVHRYGEEACRSGSPLLLAAYYHVRAAIEYRRGRINEMMGFAQGGLDGYQAGWRAVLPSSAAFLALGHMERGSAQFAAEALELPGGEDAWSRTAPYGFFLYATGRLNWVMGRHDDALRAFVRCGEHDQRLTTGPVSSNPWRSAAAVVAHRLGEQHRAEQLVGEELELVRSFGAQRAIGVALGAAATITEGQKRLALLEEAVEVLSASPAQLELARVLVDLGVELERWREPKAGWEALGKGLDLAHRCGAKLLAKQARTHLIAAGARPRQSARSGAEALSPSEARVAALAAANMTNREISEALFVTRKAVEWHLNRTFKKLGITSRRELEPALARRSRPEP